MDFEIPKNNFMGWRCAVCPAYITPNTEGLPSSHYWSAKRKEVYCSAVQGLQRHEERRKSQ